MKVPVTSWPSLREDRLLHQGLADPLHRAAMDLAGEQQRIERHPEIVDDDVVDDLDDAGGRIDLDFGQMGAVRIGAVGLVEGRARIQLRRIDARTFGQIGKAHRAVGAGDPDPAVADLQIAGAGFQRFGRDLLQLAAEIVGRTLHADAAGRDRGRTAGAEAGGDLDRYRPARCARARAAARTARRSIAHRRSDGPARSTGCRSGW